MYNLGILSLTKTTEAAPIPFFAEKGWTVTMMEIEDISCEKKDLHAILIEENTTATTCDLLIALIDQQLPDIPIFLLSASCEAQANAVYLKLGVTACFPITMDKTELFLTFNNLLAHLYKQPEAVKINTIQQNSGSSSTLQLVPANQSVMIDGFNEIHLTKKEYLVMELLCSNPQKAIPYQAFKETLWASYPQELQLNYRIANLVFQLRRKIERNTENIYFIKTVRSKGYMLDSKKNF